MDHIPEPLFDLLRGYAGLVPARLLDFPSNLSFAEIHNLLLDAILLNPHFKAYPPSREYQASFWKWAIRKLEDIATNEDDEIDERIYSHCISVIPQSSGEASGMAPPAVSYATYLWRTDAHPNCAVGPGIESATLLESRTMIEGGTTGLRTWSASLVMAQHLISHPELVRGKRVLELGSGAGFLGILIASLQQRGCLDENLGELPALYLTDVNHTVLQRCHDNTRLPCNTSSRHSNLSCHTLDWSDAVDAHTGPTMEAFLTHVDPNVIVGADLIFDPSIVHALVGSLRLAMSVNSTGRSVPEDQVTAYIALTVRNEDTFTRFLRAAEQFMTAEEVMLDSKASMFVCTAEITNEQQVRILEMRLQNCNTNAQT